MFLPADNLSHEVTNIIQKKRIQMHIMCNGDRSAVFGETLWMCVGV